MEGVGCWAHQTWFKPPKPSLQSRLICSTVYAISINNSTFSNWPIVGCVDFISHYWMKCLLVFYYITIMYSLHGSPCYNYNSVWLYIRLFHCMAWDMINWEKHKSKYLSDCDFVLVRQTHCSEDPTWSWGC